jgi:hypothetical protein
VNEASRSSRGTSAQQPSQLAIHKAAYDRTQRFLALCDRKLSYLEENPEAFEAMPVRDFRILVKSTLDLQKKLQDYADLIHAEENPPESSEKTIQEEVVLKAFYPSNNGPAELTSGQVKEASLLSQPSTADHNPVAKSYATKPTFSSMKMSKRG